MLFKMCLVQILLVSLKLKLLFRNFLEGKYSSVILSYERMTQSLQRRQSLSWVYLQDLLNKVDELEDFESLIIPVRRRQLIVVPRILLS
jgi:hypothetical protein